jgi:RHS repeat-associated protein
MVRFNYDGADRLTQSMQNGKIVNYVYQIAGRTRTVSYPGGRSVTEQMDVRNRKTGINDAGSPPIVQYSYDLSDRVMSRAYRNGTTATYSYNANDWTQSLEHSRGATRVAGFAYSYDKEGNKRTEEKRHDPAHSETYEYDASYRLVNHKVTSLVGVPRPERETAYNLDEVGNWRNRIINRRLTETRTHNAVNEITSIADIPLTHDDNGNLSEDQFLRYAYDEENRILRVTRKSDNRVLGQYQYDALGRRVVKVANLSGTPTETRYFYDDQRSIEEQNAAGLTGATYVYGNYIDEALTMDRGGQTYYYHQNALWSVVAVTNSAGSVVERYRYDAYGGVIITDGAGNPLGSSAIANPWTYTGRQLDDETGLYFYRSRYLDPSKGRFTSRDSIGIWGDPANMGNGYTYLGNSPMDETDPEGTKKGWLKKAVKAVVKSVKKVVDKVVDVAGAVKEIVTAPIRVVTRLPWIFINHVLTCTPFTAHKSKPFYGEYCGQVADGFVPHSATPIDALDKCCEAHDDCADKLSVILALSSKVRECNRTICSCASNASCAKWQPVHSTKWNKCFAARNDTILTFCWR